MRALLFLGALGAVVLHSVPAVAQGCGCGFVRPTCHRTSAARAAQNTGPGGSLDIQKVSVRVDEKGSVHLLSPPVDWSVIPKAERPKDSDQERAAWVRDMEARAEAKVRAARLAEARAPVPRPVTAPPAAAPPASVAAPEAPLARPLPESPGPTTAAADLLP